jgi:hypothetical protein
LSATITRSAEGAPSEMARAFENVALELLSDSPEPCEVQFGTWPSEDGRLQLVCRVETRPATPFGAELQWRWWSPLLDGPEELRAALSVAVRARYQRLGVTVPLARLSEAIRSF